MKVYILVGISKYRKYEGYECNFDNRVNHSVHTSKNSAMSEYKLACTFGEWGYDDYEIEEHSL